MGRSCDLAFTNNNAITDLLRHDFLDLATHEVRLHKQRDKWSLIPEKSFAGQRSRSIGRHSAVDRSESAATRRRPTTCECMYFKLIATHKSFPTARFERYFCDTQKKQANSGRSQTIHKTTLYSLWQVLHGIRFDAESGRR